MYKAVLTLLVGLMLSLSGGANALTFKSDGSVVQDGGTVVRGPAESSAANIVRNLPKELWKWTDRDICGKARLPSTFGGWQPVDGAMGKYVVEAKRRGIDCGSSNGLSQTASIVRNSPKELWKWTDRDICGKARLPSTFGGWQPVDGAMGKYVVEANRRGLSCSVDTNPSTNVISSFSADNDVHRFPLLTDSMLCHAATKQGRWEKRNAYLPQVAEAKRRGLTCGVGDSGSVQTATAPKPKVSSAELSAAQKEAQRLREELAALKAKQEEQQQIIATDNQVPLITLSQTGTLQRKGIIRGFATDNVQIAEVIVDGTTVNVAADGSFEWSGFVPATGKDIIIEAIDTAALSSRKVVRLERGQIQQASGPKFDDLDPTAGKRVKRNANALALIVGISDYKRTEAPAIYADKDAQYFHDYASLKLGIPDSNIMTLVNDKAEQGDVLLAVKDWMRRSSKAGKSDVYIFFAGHGLASQDGEQMYLLPFDGRPRLLENTAILRDELFSDIAAANPRSVTVFLDTCYSGTTRGPDMLIASRPIAIRAKEQAVPEGFTVMTAAAGDQTAKPLEEAKHGMFSYFLMKGMEGDADANKDNQITAGELHIYVQQNVIQQSSGSQTPELQGDADRVLVRFQ